MTKPKRSGAKCRCIEKVDAALSEHDTTLDVLIQFDGSVYAQVATYKQSKRGKAKMVAASYCPFCGKKYS